MSDALRPVNPWGWQDQFGFSQAIVAPPWVFCAGQGAADADGGLLHVGDIAGQLRQSLDNLETVLEQAGTDLAHVVRLNYYTTDVDVFLGVMHLAGERFGKVGHAPTSTLLGVGRLAFPEMLVEIEATALLP